MGEEKMGKLLHFPGRETEAERRYRIARDILKRSSSEIPMPYNGEPAKEAFIDQPGRFDSDDDSFLDACLPPDYDGQEDPNGLE